MPTVNPQRIIGELDDENFGYDLCKVTNLCFNGGICVSHQNEFCFYSIHHEKFILKKPN